MYLEFKAFSYILIGVSFLGISLGVVLGAYFKSNMHISIHYKSNCAPEKIRQANPSELRDLHKPTSQAGPSKPEPYKNNIKAV